MAADLPDPVQGAGRSFSRGLGILIAALGAVAILGPEPAHVAVTQVIGLLLILAGVLALLELLSRRGGRLGSRIVLAWGLSALAAGVTIELMPAHGLVSVTLLLGLLLVCHGVATSLIALKGWRTRDVVALAALFAAPALMALGLALAFVLDPGDRGDEIVIGMDMILFGLYLILGRALVANLDQGGPQGHPPGKAS